MEGIGEGREFLVPVGGVSGVLALPEAKSITGFGVVETYNIRTLDEHFDTSAYDLARAASVYRHRFSGSNFRTYFVTFKTPIAGSSNFRRREVTVEVDADTYFVGEHSRDYLDSKLESVVESRKITGNDKVAHVLTVCNRRIAIRCYTNGTLIEVAVDDITYFGRNLQSQAHEYGMKVKLINGSDTVLPDISDKLSHDFGVVEINVDKYRRGLMLLGICDLSTN